MTKEIKPDSEEVHCHINDAEVITGLEDEM